MYSVWVYRMCTGNFSDGQPNFRLWKWLRNIYTFLWAFSFVGVTLMFEIWFFLKKKKPRHFSMPWYTDANGDNHNALRTSEMWEMNEITSHDYLNWVDGQYFFFPVFAVFVCVCALSCLSAPKNVLREIFRWTFAGRIKRLLQMPADLFTLISHENFDVHMCNTTHKDLQIIPQNSNTHDRKLTTNLAQLFFSKMHWTQKKKMIIKKWVLLFGAFVVVLYCCCRIVWNYKK